MGVIWTQKSTRWWIPAWETPVKVSSFFWRQPSKRIEVTSISLWKVTLFLCFAEGHARLFIVLLVKGALFLSRLIWYTIVICSSSFYIFFVHLNAFKCDKVHPYSSGLTGNCRQNGKTATARFSPLLQDLFVYELSVWIRGKRGHTGRRLSLD